MGFFSQLFHKDQGDGTKKYVYISGMVCENCAKHVTEALKGVDGIEKVKVDLMRGQAEIIAGDDVSDDTILKTVVNAGYTATEVSSIPKSN
ncbi:heavy-metal-associated domain-containing protein [uncultured Megasphaera sp.]|uniref:heavy-metal-associated domain-containing protein n=1 Tax=uncultured Megasphaera sp. TaxID=165188 RepID=UPI0025F98052|nr:heavy-metal-associated domain-containing protein [uncultured Megasphaera sp.]